jgi:hypothetical protein
MIRSALQAAAAARTLVQLERRHSGDPRINGYVLAVGERLVLAHQFHNFSDEGWTVMRIEDLTEVLARDTEAFFDAIFRGEGLLPRDPPFRVDLSTMAAALRSIDAAGRPLIVECETPDGDDDFYLGRIIGVDDLHVHLRTLSILGHWEDPDAIALPRITMLQLETPYLVTFAKYADPPP